MLIIMITIIIIIIIIISDLYGTQGHVHSCNVATREQRIACACPRANHNFLKRVLLISVHETLPLCPSVLIVIIIISIATNHHHHHQNPLRSLLFYRYRCHTLSVPATRAIRGIIVRLRLRILQRHTRTHIHAHTTDTRRERDRFGNC